MTVEDKTGFTCADVVEPDQRAGFALVGLHLHDRISPGCLMGSSEGGLQAQHDVLHYTGAGAPDTKKCLEGKLKGWEEGRLKRKQLQDEW